MPIRIQPKPAPLPADLIERYRGVTPATVGHMIEAGAATPALAPLFRPVKLVGRAITVRITSPDSTLVHHVMDLIEPGDVLVIATGGNTRHAAIGEMTSLAARARGAAGVVIDGPATDIAEITRMQFPVFSKGTSPMTTKLYGIGDGSINEPITCDGVLVRPGDLVFGDDNGVIFLAPELAAALIDGAEQREAREPETRRYLEGGGSLPERSGANRLLRERFGL